MKRRLAAILQADLVGYSRLASLDEVGTHRRLQNLRSHFIEPLIQGHDGRLVKTMGDGFLCVFDSAVDAAECALEWQEGPIDAASDDTELRFRIGLGVGDVIVEADDVFGSGVNIAARLEGIAGPGEIAVSDDAYRQIHGKLDADFDDLGEQSLKNIPQAVRVYRMRRAGSDRPPDRSSTSPDDLERPSIAVMPFANRSGDPEQEYFADGITEDLITALSRIRWFVVIARNSTFAYKGTTSDARRVAGELGVRYVLEGSVRRSGDRVRLNIELTDGTNGHQLWAERYDRQLEDIFDLQDEMTATIVGALEPELSRAEMERAKAKRPENIGAWDRYLQGMAQMYLMTEEGFVAARRFFEEAVGMDGTLAPAYTGLAEAHYYEVVYGFAVAEERSRKLALEAAHQAVAADMEDAAAHCSLGRAHYLNGDHENAILELRRALEMNPSLALAHYGLGAALVFSDRSSEGLPHLETAIRLSPRDPNMGSFLVRLADAAFMVGDLDRAVGEAKRALQQPNFQWSRYAVLIAALGAMGQKEDAAPYLERVIQKRPDFSVDFVRKGHLYRDGEHFERYLDGLRAAGVPEGEVAANEG